MKHVHGGFLFIVAVAAAMVLINSAARVTAAKNPDQPWARALAFVF